jgi:amidohydrolase
MNDNLFQQIRQFTKSILPSVIGFREHLHRNPELSFEEFNTMDFVCKHLDSLQIPYIKGIAGTGITAFIRGRFDEKTEHVVLRGDMDALPIHEQNEVAYKSKVDGVMHACGHDVHTANLMGVATILKKFENDLVNPVQLIFQPGEEKAPGGASLLIKQNILKHNPIKGIYALHVFPEMEAGKVGFRSGLYMASCDEIHIKVNGKGGHAAMPHQCKDPIIAGTLLMQTAHAQLYKSCDPKIPMVLSFGHFEAIGATNVIPSTATIKGTFRTMNEEWREDALDLLKSICDGVSESTDTKIELNIVRGYPYLENNPELTDELNQAAKEILGENNVEDLPIRLTAEDFSFYSHHVPACFFRLGVRNEKKGITFGVHHPRFDIDSSALQTGMEVLSLTAFI